MAGVLGRFKPDFDDVDCFRDPVHHALRGHDEGEEYKKYKKCDLVNHFVL